MVRYIGAVILLTLIYAGTLASADPWDFAFGALLAVGLLALFRQFLHQDLANSPPLRARRLIATIPLLWAVLREIVIGTWRVARIILAPRPTNLPGMLTLPFGDRSRGGVVISALMISLSPGSSLIVIDWERREMLLHLIHIRDPDHERAELQRFYEQYQRAVFP